MSKSPFSRDGAPNDPEALAHTLQHSLEAHKRLEDVIKSIPGVVWEFDPRKRAFTFLRDYASVLTEHQIEQLMHGYEQFLQQLHPDDLDGLRALWPDIRTSPMVRTWRFRIRSDAHSGGWRWLQAVIVPVFDEEGALCVLRGMTYDVHRLVEIQQLHDRYMHQLQALINFSSRFVEARTEEEVIVALRELIAHTLDFKFIAVYLSRRHVAVEKARVIDSRVVWEKTDIALVKDVTRLRDVMIGHLPYFVSQDALSDVSELERQNWMGLLGEHRVFSNAVVPIRGRTQVLGALAVDRRDSIQPITSAELDMLLTIGRYAGLALDNVRLMQDLRMAEERLRHLVQNLPVIVWEVDASARKISFISESVEDWLGYPQEEWYNNPQLYRKVIHPEDIHIIEQLLTDPREVPSRNVELRLLDKKGNWRWCHTHWTSVQDDSVSIVWGVTVDISEQKEAEQQRIRLMRLRSLGEIASGVAHSFNNILMGILGNAELLQASLEHAPELSQRAELIARLSQDASDIVKRMEGFYQPHITSKRERVSLRSLLQDVVETTRPVWRDLAERRNATIQVRMHIEAEPLVEAIRGELHEVFTNLVMNACEAMPEGGTLTITLREQEGQAVVEVADTGVGMSPEVQKHCFDAFFTTKGEIGSGLGLSVSYQIVSRHAGQIEVQSEVGKGTIFTVRLPIATDAPPIPKEGSVASLPPTLRVLFVDDDEAVRIAIQHLLEADGHHIAAFSEPSAALEAFRTQSFDLAILDLGMPKIDGLSLARRLKEISPNVPVILLTGWGDQLREHKPHEIDLVLAKPVRRAALRAVLLELARR